MATCMQPGIPVFTVAIAVLMKQEVASFQKVAGILLACFGAICMVRHISSSTFAHSYS